MKFAFTREKQVAYPVATVCRVLGVSASGYYDWLKAPDSLRAKQDAELAVKIAQTHERSRRRYGFVAMESQEISFPPARSDVGRTRSRRGA